MPNLSGSKYQVKHCTNKVGLGLGLSNDGKNSPHTAKLIEDGGGGGVYSACA